MGMEGHCREAHHDRVLTWLIMLEIAYDTDDFARAFDRRDICVRKAARVVVWRSP